MHLTPIPHSITHFRPFPHTQTLHCTHTEAKAPPPPHLAGRARVKLDFGLLQRQRDDGVAHPRSPRQRALHGGAAAGAGHALHTEPAQSGGGGGGGVFLVVGEAVRWRVAAGGRRRVTAATQSSSSPRELCHRLLLQQLHRQAASSLKGARRRAMAAPSGRPPPHSRANHVRHADIEGSIMNSNNRTCRWSVGYRYGRRAATAPAHLGEVLESLTRRVPHSSQLQELHQAFCHACSC